jgi:thioredoxin reductase
VLGVRIEAGEVTGARHEGGIFHLEAGDTWTATCLILATGTRPRGAAPPGFCGPVHHGTDTLPKRLAGRRVWVSGGGDAAFDSALQARRRGAEVDLFLRGAPKAMALLVARAEVAGVRVRRGRSVAEALVASTPDHLLICHGRAPEDTLLAGLGADRPGLFLAGDLARGRLRYAAVAAGDGLAAARLAEDWLGR